MSRVLHPPRVILTYYSTRVQYFKTNEFGYITQFSKLNALVDTPYSSTCTELLVLHSSGVLVRGTSTIIVQVQ